MKKVLVNSLFAVMAIIAIFSVNVFACACCADSGAYLVRTAMPSEYERSLFSEMKFGEKASLYMTAGEFEAIKGLDVVKNENDAGTSGDFDLTQTYNNTGWKLTLKTPGGKTGTLTLPRPAKFTSRKIDRNMGLKVSGEPVLYKEFTFTGTVAAGTGFFAKGIAKPTTYTLAFIGKGNMCDNAQDFDAWHLDVAGPKASYSFFGTMKQ